MLDATQNSFIPKRGPVKQVRRAVKKQIYLLTLIAYIAFFASVIAAGAVFVYQQYVQSQLAAAVLEFNNTANSFSESDLRRVTLLESRMRQAQFAIARQFSVAKLLERIELSTAVSSQINNLTITRIQTSAADLFNGAGAQVPTIEPGEAQFFSVEADLVTNSYDSVIFQRDTFAALEDVPVLSVTNVSRSFADVAVSASINQLINNQQNQSEQTNYGLALVFVAEPFKSNPADAANETRQITQTAQTSTINQPLEVDNLVTVEEGVIDEVE